MYQVKEFKVKLLSEVNPIIKIFMNYEEFVRNTGKSGLNIKGVPSLIKSKPNSLTNLKSKDIILKNLAIISVLRGELVDKKIVFHFVINFS